MPRSIAAVLLTVVCFGGLLAQSRGTDGSWRLAPPGTKPSTPSWTTPAPPTPQPTPGLRRVRGQRGQSLASLVLPGESAVEAVGSFGPGFAGGSEDADAELAALARDASAAVVVRISGITSELNAAQDWLESRVEAEIETVAKPTTRSNELIVGNTLVFPVSGGQLTINGTLVRARKEWADFPETGKRYLYFLARDYWGNLNPSSETFTFELQQGRLRRLHRGADWGIDRRAIDEERALAVIRQAAVTAPAQLGLQRE
jgi:hypothetical protein